MTAFDSADFTTVWCGYDRLEVRIYVRSVEAAMHLLCTERDEAAARTEDVARQLGRLHADNRRLRARLARICGAPGDVDVLRERLRRRVELAEAEAREIISKAQVSAEHSWANAQRAAARLREHHERLIAELDARGRDTQTEHDDLMRHTHTQVEAMTLWARQRWCQLNEKAAERHRRIEDDFEVAMRVRRIESAQSMAEHDVAAQAEAQRLLREAAERAGQVVAEARQLLDVVWDLRDRVADDLDTTRRLLAGATPLQPEATEPAAAE